MGSVYGQVGEEAADLIEREMFRGDGVTPLAVREEAECFSAVASALIKAAGRL